ncbi:DUF6629 family protein [Sorangium sp. So ce887]|uniref:DUF6629 family protein n=1 Tax=Sorangium sp. So ce887 TaxID=3133324 RepID=UPI003F5EDC5F
MCFSAQASFAAAAALTGIGVLTLRSAPSRAHLPVAAIPLLFAIQQACEGAVWLVLRDAPFGRGDTSFARVFLFFALFVWPAYVPGALVPIEFARARRRALMALSAGGAVLGLYLLGCASLRESDACIAFDNLYYWIQIDAPLKPFVAYVYAAFIIAPLVLSSVRGTSLLAVVVAASFALIGSLYRAGFVSVWCFLAAAISGVTGLVVYRDTGSPHVLSAPLRRADRRPKQLA